MRMVLNDKEFFFLALLAIMGMSVDHHRLLSFVNIGKAK
jgi:hypothetical protein